MLIINADDWGRTREETDAALRCFRQGRISSATAMVFMEDSERGAELAKECGIDLGLHLNLTQNFNGPGASDALRESQARVVRYLTSGKYAFLLYNPVLRADFRRVYEGQRAEFARLHGREPSHVDGHRHMHLCTNILLGGVLPGGERVRRGFHFWPGEKSLPNRLYRRAVDQLLLQSRRSTDFFFALSQCLQPQRLDRVIELAKGHIVELMTHPVAPLEQAHLLGEVHRRHLDQVQLGTYAQL